MASVLIVQVCHPEDSDSPGSIFNKEDFNSEREFTSVNGRKYAFHAFLLARNLH